MLEHPVFVRWCELCGHEAPEEEDLTCPRCSGPIERYQRVLELPDTSEGDTAFALHSLKTALAEVSGGDDISAAAVVLSEQGPDPLVAGMDPGFALRLVALGVPPSVQRALFCSGFDSFDRISVAVSSMSEAGAWAEQLGLPPAAEVLLRRLWHAAVDAQKFQHEEEPKRRHATEADNHSLFDYGFPADIHLQERLAAKRCRPRFPRRCPEVAMVQEPAVRFGRRRQHEPMQAMADECDDAEDCTDQSSDSEELAIESCSRHC